MPCACEDHLACAALEARQRVTLRVVLVINAAMFLVVATAALYADSTALLADSLDNLGDALTYALSLYAVARGPSIKARVALFKGALILFAAAGVAVQIVHRLLTPGLPVFEVMGAFSLLGLAANGLCFWLLTRHRFDDVNMSSVWECSRNDIAANVAVFIAAGGVALTGAAWPDLLVAMGLVLLLARSALRVIGSAWLELERQS